MHLEHREVGDLFDIAQSILNKQFSHNKSELGRHVSLSQPTVNRTLRKDSDQKPHTRKRHLITILQDLAEQGYLVKSELNDQPVHSRTDIAAEEQGEAIAIPMATFKASAGNGNYVTESKELDRYVIDKKELGPAAQAALKKKGMMLIEVEGNSMLPDLRPGERVIVELTESSHTIKNDAVYLIRIEDAIMLKALQRRPGNKLVVISRSDTYPNYTINLDDDPDLEVIGKVWGRFQRLG